MLLATGSSLGHFYELHYSVPELELVAAIVAADQIVAREDVAAVGYGAPMTRNSGKILRLWSSI